MIDLVIDKEGSYNCFESLVVSTMKWKKRDYELMLSQSWGFRFDKPADDSTICIGEYLYADNSKMLKALEEYHGLKIKVGDAKDEKEFINEVKKELESGLPVMFLSDVFWFPWYKGSYQTKHSPHYVIILDVDKEENLWCMDSQAAAAEAGCMPYDHLAHSYHDNFVTFMFTEDECREPELKDLLIQPIHKLKQTNYYGNAFEQMRVLSSYINDNGIDFTRETNINLDIILEKAVEKYSYGFSDKQMDMFAGYIKSTGLNLDPHEAYLFDSMRELANGRNKFKNYLLYLAERYKAEELLLFAERIKKAADRWYSVFGLLAKAFYLTDSSAIIKRVAARINEAADDEEEIAQGIEDFVKNKSINSEFLTVGDLGKEETNNIVLNRNKVQPVELDKYFNSKGFAKLSSPGRAEISNGGRFLISDYLPTEKLWIMDNMLFQFPQTDTEYNDNISCSGQVIESLYSGFKFIMFLGCAEFGDHSEDVLIEHKDGNMEKVPLEFSSWLKAEPNFNEKVAWVGKCAVKNGDKIDVYNFPAHLYAKYYPLKNEEDIVKITLPMCPNIHLFGISLG